MNGSFTTECPALDKASQAVSNYCKGNIVSISGNTGEKIKATVLEVGVNLLTGGYMKVQVEAGIEITEGEWYGILLKSGEDDNQYTLMQGAIERHTIRLN